MSTISNIVPESAVARDGPAGLPATGWWTNPLRPRPSETDHVGRVTDYYLHTWKDYRGAWMNARNRSMHFGYWDCSVADHADSLARSNQVLASLARIDRSTLCLDLGAGVGGTAMWIADTFGAQVTGLTIVADQAERMGRYAAERGLDRLVTPSIGDYHRLDFPDNSFDVVYAQEALCHSPNPIVALREARRVLRPGGRIVFMEYIVGGGPTSLAFRRWLDAWCMPTLIVEHELRAWADHDGFDRWEIIDATRHVTPSVLRLRSLCRATLSGQRALARVGLRSSVQIQNVVGSLAMYDALVNGDWYYGIFSGQAP